MSHAETIATDPAEADGNSAPAAARGGDSTPRAAVVSLDRYEIYPDQPLAGYHYAYANCYAAADIKGAREALMALVANERVPPRADILPSLRSVDNAGLIRPYRWGPVDWPGGGGRRFAIFYGHPGGQRVMPSLAEPFPALSEDSISQGVVKPMLSVLAELASRGITHRGIRPDNLFFKDLAQRQVILGDCAMLPPGAANPVLYETIENGMTHPLARGPGSAEDDLYALGVTLLVLSLGGNPVPGMSDHDIIAAKIDKGSYAVLAGTHHILPALREPIRGLLADAPAERWTLQELALWLDGRRLSPIQPSIPPQAGRGFPFAGGQYFSCRALAHAMAARPDAVATALVENNLEAWISRSVGDAKTAAGVTAALAKSSAESGAAAGMDHMLVARICMVLDPQGPICYKSLATKVEGLGPQLAALVHDPNGAQPFAQLIASDLPLSYVGQRYGDGPEARTLVKNLDRMRYQLKNPAPGYGVERCLYELNPSLPCASPIIESYYVADAEDALPALERAAGAKDRPTFPIDRHLAAFIATRFRQGTEDHLAALANRNDPGKMVLAALRTLAVMQWRLGPPNLPKLTEWLGRLAESVVDGYHGVALRAGLKEQLARVIRKGSLVELLNLIDDKALRDRDAQGYQKALAEYFAAEAEIESLSATGGALERRAESLAGRIAVFISAFIAIGTIAVLAVMRWS